MKYSLRMKLTISYIFIILLLVSLIFLFTNVILERHFQDYVIRQQDERNREVIGLITQQYKGNDKWNREVIENIGINALENGLIVRVKDIEGNIVWDATVHNNGMCTQMLADIAKNMESRYKNFNGQYVENPYPLYKDSEQFGVVEIGYYGPFYFNDSDLDFINSLNKVLIVIGLFSLLLAIAFGTIMASRLSYPISRVIKATQIIEKGDYGYKIVEESSTKEIGQLTTAINNLAQTLENQESLRKRMSLDVAHEFRTPIATLQSHLEAMIDGIWQPDAQRLKSCHEEVLRIGRMVGDLEKLVKYEGENLVLNKESFNLSTLIQTIIHNFESDFKAKEVQIKYINKKYMLLADRDKISQIVVNLLSNALKYTYKGGMVEIEVTQLDKAVKIVVRDNGIGIAEEDLPYIFERFYRADKSRNRNTGGAGIGLTIAKSLVDAHRGEIKVKSELGKGSEFTVVLPSS
ncbi:MAG: HAMP domain-containing protein [Clostridiaceae bacterium]|nr:HAMP domain-containing protein [Clostridiaceae bacterium]